MGFNNHNKNFLFARKTEDESKAEEGSFALNTFMHVSTEYKNAFRVFIHDAINTYVSEPSHLSVPHQL